MVFYIFLLLIKQFNICKSLLLFKLNCYQFLFDTFCTNIIVTDPIMKLTMIVMTRSQYVLQSTTLSFPYCTHVWFHSYFAPFLRHLYSNLSASSATFLQRVAEVAMDWYTRISTTESSMQQTNKVTMQMNCQ